MLNDCIVFSPESAESLSFDVEVGDILVVGTDGLFDNMSDDLILHHTSTLKVRSALYY